MTESNARTFGVFIDAAQVSAEVAGPVLAVLGGLGELAMKRAYADWGSPDAQPWARELARQAIAPMQQIEFSAGRHSERTALVIHALDLHTAGVVDSFAIVCDDDSYTSLATRLRAGGATVVGVGGPDVTFQFAEACTTYYDIDELYAGASANRVAIAAAAMGRRIA